MWTPIGKFAVKAFFQNILDCLLIGKNVSKKQKILNFENLKKGSNRGKKISKNNFWKYFYPQNLIFSGFGPKNVHLRIPIKSCPFLFTFWPISKQTADVQKNVEGLE